MKNIDIIIEKNNQYANADKQNDLTTIKYITKITLSMLQLMNTIKKERFAYEDTFFTKLKIKIILINSILLWIALIVKQK